MSSGKGLFRNVWSAVTSLSFNWSESLMVKNVRFLSQSSQLQKNDVIKTAIAPKQTKEFVTPTPYKNPGPRRYGYRIRYKTQGCLPRDDNPVRSLPSYKAVNSWDTKAALFGQNDYIDILGDGDIHPADLLTGPRWVVGFKGNERERLLRKMEWQGARMRLLYPAEYNRVQKRIRFLTKLYNTKRHTRKKD